MRVDEWIWPFSADLSAAKRNNIALQASETHGGEGEQKVEIWYNVYILKKMLWAELPSE